jgi:hypothetical protein
MWKRAVYLYLTMTLLTLLAMGATAKACELQGVATKIDRSEELRDYFYLWVELELYGEAENEWARVVGALDEASTALQGCDPSHEFLVLNQRLLVMRAWARRARWKSNLADR